MLNFIEDQYKKKFNTYHMYYSKFEEFSDIELNSINLIEYIYIWIEHISIYNGYIMNRINNIQTQENDI